MSDEFQIVERNPINMDALMCIVEDEIRSQGALWDGERYDGMVFIGHLQGPDGCFTTGGVWPHTIPSLTVLDLVSNFLQGAVQSGMFDDLEGDDQLLVRMVASILSRISSGDGEEDGDE